jgi:sugar phosphate isomerase/epimerase
MALTSEDRRYTRRGFGKLALGSVPAIGFLAAPAVAAWPLQRQSSVFGGVTIGMIGNLGLTTTDPRALAAAAAGIGLSSVELGAGPMETFAGAPAAPARGAGPGGGRQGRGPAAPLTPEQEAERRAYATAIAAWRASAPMDKFREFAQIYRDAGIRIHAFRITLTEAMSDAEYDYAFNAARTVGASSLTMELPTNGAMTKRIGDFAANHRVMTGYHTHLQATPTIFDEALSQSPYNGIQLDIGHYVAATSQSPIPLIERHHGRITSMHLKDRKVNAGANLPWGQGDTPIREVLQLMKAQGYTWPAFIELEYPVPDGSTRVAEIGKCLEYCRNALA